MAKRSDETDRLTTVMCGVVYNVLNNHPNRLLPNVAL